MARSSTGFIVLLFVVSVHLGVTLPSTAVTQAGSLVMRMSLTRAVPVCNGTCITNVENCTIKTGSCYIEGRCYEANETRLNSNTSCLQCRPDNNQISWSFNPACSPGDYCERTDFLMANQCPSQVIQGFYMDAQEAAIALYNFQECGRDRNQCQSGFFIDKTNSSSSRVRACCPGFFCPDGQACMIPCRNGSYCPSPLKGSNGTCQSTVKCPKTQPTEYGAYGCGGSTFEGFCPAGFYCEISAMERPCDNGTKYCPTGVQKPLDCPSGFFCESGRARRTLIIVRVLVIVTVIVIVYALSAELLQWLILTKKVLGQYSAQDPPGVSNYFRKPSKSSRSKRGMELHIHLNRAKLRNVTRFDQKRNPGFTGRIAAGKLTALMGGSGCGKSSLLETIHGRRQLQKDGYITFGEHKPLTNELTDYVGYVPQADIMHNDLTVFETVYYSARARRLADDKQVIINDVCFVLESLGLKNMHNSMTRTLSGGEGRDRACVSEGLKKIFADEYRQRCDRLI